MKLSNRVVWVFILAIAACVASAGAEGEPSAPPSSQPAAKAKVVLPLARATPQPIGRYTLADLKRMFPQFQHEPFETAGFNHLSLPFHYDAPDGGGDPNEANAFAFLLSHALDWAPGCYCARHAYFVFKSKSARVHMTALARGYDPERIKFLVNDWRATHAVGGKLIYTEKGYSGTLLIYDRAGRVVRNTTYDQPRSFFQLLGDMSVDAMKTFGYTPSPALVEHLHIEQCRHRQTLIDLGRAARLELQSKAVLAAYDNILHREPGFATVRVWRANQGSWAGGSGQPQALHLAKALDSYLVENGLWDFDPDECPDEDLAAKFPQWLAQAEKLVGPDSPVVLEPQLEAAYRAQSISLALLDRAAQVARRYPNDYWFLFRLERAWAYGRELPTDSDMAASICVAAVQSRYLPGSGGKTHVAKDLSLWTRNLGYQDAAAQLLLPVAMRKLKSDDPREVTWEADRLGEALFDLGRFEEAMQWFRVGFKGSDPNSDRGRRLLVDGAVAAAHAGRMDVLEQILRDRREELGAAKMLVVVEVYRSLLRGEAPKPSKLKEIGLVSSWNKKHAMMCRAQRELMFGGGRQQRRLDHSFEKHACKRPMAIIMDAYYRRDPELETGSFYEAIEWLWPRDPWVVEAVAAWRKRGANGWVPDPEQLLTDLKDFPPVRKLTPDPSKSQLAREVWRELHAGAMACAVRKLVEAGRFDKAEELALRFSNLAVDTGDLYMRGHATHLVRRVERARAEAKAKGRMTPDDL